MDYRVGCMLSCCIESQKIQMTGFSKDHLIYPVPLSLPLLLADINHVFKKPPVRADLHGLLQS